MNKIFSLLSFILLNINAYAQNKVFDYLNVGLSTSDCNVFDPSVNIDGSSHQSWAGGVTFNATLGLGLQTQ